MGYLFLGLALFAGVTKGYCGKRTSGYTKDFGDAILANCIRMLLCIVIGLVLMLYWSFGGQVGINRKHFARAYLIFYAISLVLSFVMMGVIGSVTSEIVSGGLSLF